MGRGWMRPSCGERAAGGVLELQPLPAAGNPPPPPPAASPRGGGKIDKMPGYGTRCNLLGHLESPLQQHIASRRYLLPPHPVSTAVASRPQREVRVPLSRSPLRCTYSRLRRGLS